MSPLPAAGCRLLARMPFVFFSLWTILGKAGRYLAVAWGAHALLG